MAIRRVDHRPFCCINRCWFLTSFNWSSRDVCLESQANFMIGLWGYPKNRKTCPVDVLGRFTIDSQLEMGERNPKLIQNDPSKGLRVGNLRVHKRFSTHSKKENARLRTSVCLEAFQMKKDCWKMGGECRESRERIR